MSEWIYKPVTELAAAVRRKQVSALELVDAHLAHIEVVNPDLNAVVQLASERAREEATEADNKTVRGELLGPLHGVPVTIKDSLDTEGIITTWGTEGRRTYTPNKDATAVARLRKAGAIVVGKTNTPELTISGGEMSNPIHGATFNPFDLSKSPGASSGGAAAIIAAGGSPLDLGSDTGGSIREPAHMCGIAGIKPTTGRVPLTGHAISFDAGAVAGLTQIGPMARCVKDLELVLPLIWGPDGVDPSVVEKPWRDPAAVKDDDLCIAVHTTDGVTSVDQVVGQTVVAAAEILVDAGFNIEESVPPPLKRAEELRTWLSYMDKGAWLRRILKKAGTSKPGLVMERLLNEADASDVPAMETVLREVQRFRNEMLIFMARFDAIICPTQAHATKAHGAPQAFVTGPERGSEKHHGWGFMYAYNLTGWPAAVVRAGETNDGLPIGVQIVAPPWREDIVFALAEAIEHLCGGFHPPRQTNFTYWREP